MWSAIFEHPHRLLYCPVRGCGATAWKQFLLYLNGELIDPTVRLPFREFFDRYTFEQVVHSQVTTLVQDKEIQVSYLFVR